MLSHNNVESNSRLEQNQFQQLIFVESGLSNIITGIETNPQTQIYVYEDNNLYYA